eukprot:TRINITY_DN3758_c0_g1_i1.p1 TRINITY_DN3758_c0_g1~~TRINITY_DN3758_c0_g1_i1.p1  ORF type:complete len:188 (-),score=41.32 TRINITY_DN3758_c0_g1_i1:243-806(-)
MTETRLKICFIGDFGVGKSAMVTQFAEKKFYDGDSRDAQQVTECVATVDARVVPLQLWDTAGSERFSTLTVSYYRSIDAAVLVYDISNKESFTNLENWVRELEQFTHDARIVKILVGNKLDLEAERKVTKEEASHFAEENKCKNFEVSAKTGANIESMVHTLIRDYNNGGDMKKVNAAKGKKGCRIL